MERESPFSPAPIDEVVAAIKKSRPDVVFAPHVETSAGIILPLDYIRKVSNAVHSVGGILVLDCIASGAIWIDMVESGVDVLISAPQKGWSASPCCALVMLSNLGRDRIDDTESSSYVCDLLKWLEIMETYEKGSHSYHATMPTDSLVKFEKTVKETEEFGFENARDQQNYIGHSIRALLEGKGFKSVAADGFKATSVVVSYTENDSFQNGKIFAENGMQIAAGVPLECGEGDDFKTFRLGLFGLDKLKNPDRTISNFKDVLDKIC